MDYLFILNVLTSYSLPTLIIAVIVSALSIVFDLIFKDKIPTNVKLNAPFFIAFLLCFVYDTAFVVKDFSFREETITFGIVSGSLSVVLIRSFFSLINGKSLTTDTTLLLIEGIIEEVIEPSSVKSVSVMIKNIIETPLDIEYQKTEIVEIIVVNSDKDLSTEQIESVATLILKSVSAI
jgi:hypothetical protein